MEEEEEEVRDTQHSAFLLLTLAGEQRGGRSGLCLANQCFAYLPPHPTPPYPYPYPTLQAEPLRMQWATRDAIKL